uniref:Uncharacterized protein n=1 Tax=Amphimedon queenslandica TaxID=400682 RepID=A0A1X7UJC9_AMPQE
MGLNHGIKRFTGQGLEKKNHVARRNCFSSNHLDAPKEILVTDARLHMLSQYKRLEHIYNKKNEDYWCYKIYEKKTRKADDLTN